MARGVSARLAAAAVAIHGVDFTSTPRRAKPITVATGRLRGGALELESLDEIGDFAGFETWLERPGPWVAGFDFPFGLPRAALVELGWPQALPELTRHCRALGRDAFRAALDGHRAARPVGSKYCYRSGDAAAAAHSPLKLVNPPVALMFFEGVPRLIAAGVDIPGMVAGDRSRVALETYPGYVVRRLCGTRARVSYKNDAPGKQTRAQREMRERILEHVTAAAAPLGVRLRATARQLAAMRDDGSGDLLDATLCALQAAWAWMRRHRRYGLPAGIDPVEGWIVSVPAPARQGRGTVFSRQATEAFG